MLTCLNYWLRQYHPLAQLYLTAAEIYRELEDKDKINLRLFIVDTDRVGHVREAPAVEGRQPIDVAQHLPKLPHNVPQIKQIHPGRIIFPTKDMGDKLVAQVNKNLYR